MESNSQNDQRRTREPEFRTFRKRVLVGSQALCLLGLAFGYFLNLPYIMGLNVIGLVVSCLKLSTSVDR